MGLDVVDELLDSGPKPTRTKKGAWPCRDSRGMCHYCDACGTRIQSPESRKVCLESHDWTDEYESVAVHLACPCPDHGWDGDFVYPGDR